MTTTLSILGIVLAAFLLTWGPGARYLGRRLLDDFPTG